MRHDLRNQLKIRLFDNDLSAEHFFFARVFFNNMRYGEVVQDMMIGTAGNTDVIQRCGGHQTDLDQMIVFDLSYVVQEVLEASVEVREHSVLVSGPQGGKKKNERRRLVV